ncbi:MAG TPA: hypothetical protein VKA00_08625 [Trueperaceae bacterium]|nr:hypothetical protein [Trueperaceae bacterium]
MLGAIASAQTIQCVPKKDCGNPVQFAPSQAEFVAALGASLQPAAPAMPIQLKLHPKQGSEMSAEISRSPWTPTAPIVVEAQATVSGPHMAAMTLEWMPLSETPRTLLVGDSGLTDLALDFRLRPDSAVPPGTYTALIRYHLWNSAQVHDGSGETTITSVVTVIVPAFVVLRLDGSVAGSLSTVHFDYSGGNAAAYVAAISAGSPLSFTSADFRSIEVATNDPWGYSVEVSVAQSTGSRIAHPNAGDVLITGKPAQATVLSSAHATDGFQGLLTPADFSMRVDGSEVPGSYTFRVTFHAFPNP